MHPPIFHVDYSRAISSYGLCIIRFWCDSCWILSDYQRGLCCCVLCYLIVRVIDCCKFNFTTSPIFCLRHCIISTVLTAVLVFKCLHGLAPEYLSEYCKMTTGRSHLRSANGCLLFVPHTRTTYGDGSFAISGPLAWNSLPVALRSSDVTEETFRRHLKTFLFNCLDS